MFFSAQKNNQDLMIANVDRARALARVDKSALLPKVEFNPFVERSRTSGNASTFGQSSQTTNDFHLPVDLSYEVDLWGRVRRAFAAGRAEAQAQAAA